MSVICKERALKFWLKIQKKVDSPIYNVHTDQCNALNRKFWANCTKSVIDRLGFSYTLNDFDPERNYLPMFKRRLRDQYMQDWSTSISNMPKLDYYRKFKTMFCHEDYLDIITSDKLRKQLSCFRLSSHCLEIEFGRYTGIIRENRLCKLCTQNTVESEYHFMLCCSRYSDIRNKYLGSMSWPTVTKFESLMCTKNKRLLLRISKYLKEAFVKRSNTLEIMTVS